MMTRDEHMEWAKQRAMAYLPANPQEAFTSFGSDLNKHPETENHPAMTLGMMMLLNGHLKTPAQMETFIRGTH